MHELKHNLDWNRDLNCAACKVMMISLNEINPLQEQGVVEKRRIP
jgi:hypothetical protein